MKLTKLRVLVLVVGVWAVTSSLHAPAALADIVPGAPATCSRDAIIYNGTVFNVSREDIRFRLKITTTVPYLAVVGRWEFSNGSLGALFYAGGGNGASLWAQVGTGSAWGPLQLRFQSSLPQGSTARFHVFLPGQFATVDGCFTIEAVSVSRDFFVSPDPLPPTSGPITPTPFASSSPPPPSGSPNASSTPVATGGGVGDGYCPVYIPPNWQWVPCALLPSPTPTPTAPPSPSAFECHDSQLPIYGTGTYTLQAGAVTDSDGACVLVIANSTATTGQALLLTWSLTVPWDFAGGFADRTHWVVGYQAIETDGFTVLGGNGAISAHYSITQTIGSSESCSGSSCTLSGSGVEVLNGSSPWTYVVLYGERRAFSYGTGNYVAAAGGKSVSGTITVSRVPASTGTPVGGFPSPTPTPSATSSQQAYCADNPDVLVCVTLPPDWGATPSPGSTMPAPGELLGASFDPGALDPVASAVGGLQSALGAHAPFSWAGEVATALDPSGYAGADIAWCFDVFGSHICVDPYTVTDPIAGYRSVFLGLLAVLVAWAVARRVWAVVGGTPGAPDA